jgi:hypothetical protein
MNLKTGDTYSNSYKEENVGFSTKKVNLRFFTDKPAKYEIIYTRELLKDSFDKAIEKTLYIVRNYNDIINNDGAVNCNDIIGIVKNYQIHENGKVEFEVQPTIITEPFDGYFQLEVIGTGLVDYNNYVTEFDLIALFVSEDVNYLMELK